MANKSAAKKYIKQSEKRRMQNKSIRTKVRTALKVARAIVLGESREDAMLKLKKFEQYGMKAASKGVYKRDTVSRLVSRVYSLIRKRFTVVS